MSLEKILVTDKKRKIKLPKLSENVHNRLLGLFSVTIFILVWEYVSVNKMVNPIFTGMPSEIAREAIKLFQKGEVWLLVWQSFYPFILAFTSAILAGVLLGIIIGINKQILPILSPFIYTLDTVPKIVILPLVIIWLGIGPTAKFFFIFMMAIIPILISTIDAVKSMDEKKIYMAKSFGAKRHFFIYSVVIFDILPRVFSSVKVARGIALIGMVVAEFFGLGKGIGYLISFYGSTYQINKLMVMVLFLLLFNGLLVYIIDTLRIKTIFWQKEFNKY